MTMNAPAEYAVIVPPAIRPTVGFMLAHPAHAMALGWGLAHFVFEFAWQASPWVMVIGVLAGAGLAWAAGWWGLREVLQRPVVQTLRQAAH